MPPARSLKIKTDLPPSPILAPPPFFSGSATPTSINTSSEMPAMGLLPSTSFRDPGDKNDQRSERSSSSGTQNAVPHSQTKGESNDRESDESEWGGGSPSSGAPGPVTISPASQRSMRESLSQFLQQSTISSAADDNTEGYPSGARSDDQTPSPSREKPGELVSPPAMTRHTGEPLPLNAADVAAFFKQGLERDTDESMPEDAAINSLRRGEGEDDTPMAVPESQGADHVRARSSNDQERDGQDMEWRSWEEHVTEDGYVTPFQFDSTAPHSHVLCAFIPTVCMPTQVRIYFPCEWRRVAMGYSLGALSRGTSKCAEGSTVRSRSRHRCVGSRFCFWRL